MKVVVWLAEGTWQACVDAAAEVAPPSASIALLHVIDPALASDVSDAFAGLVGRGTRGDPGAAVGAAAARAAEQLLAAAAARLDRPSSPVRRTGRLEREVVAAAEGADLLVVARDGPVSRLGPRSLNPPTRFVVDHAPCAVLLVWPTAPPAVDTIPPPPPHKATPPHKAAPPKKAAPPHKAAPPPPPH
ncbi:universal stress protein [Asanoa sp. NPDC049573]|uniref:universal stress protein n=1 Tax=Asanoa sp. NPDC049573 TaxID=3155396 RepID=UPI003424491A